MTRLEREDTLLAAYSNPQGRTIAILRLIAAAPGEFLAVLPRELAGTVAERLRRFVLRSKVTIVDESPRWRLRGRFGAPLEIGAKTPRARLGGQPERWLELTPRDADAAAPVPGAAGERDAWLLQDVAAGVAQVYAATSEMFVAQMLNLDLVDAISFDKGCYTGQEVIARAHYRGRVKRRLQRFSTLAPAALSPGDVLQLADGRSARVVESARHPDGRCEFLAVAALALPGAGAAPEPDEGPSEARARAIEAQSLPLPYPLP
jgi:folate-binding protein YgfZ